MPFRARRIAEAASDTALFELLVPTDLNRIAEAVDAVTSCCHSHRALSKHEKFRLCTVVAETLTNAMSYGNGNDPNRWVTVRMELKVNCLVLAVTDEGIGFNPESVPDIDGDLCHEATRGRGLFIIRELADTVMFNDKGNTILVTLPLQ